VFEILVEANMPVINRMAELHDEITAWRHHYHANPELLYDVHETAADVARKLHAFGCDEVVTGIGRTGVVGVIRGSRQGERVIGLRADMDALPIAEQTGKPYSSMNPGKMHACGHDGHTSMLLGAARYLAETRNFAGTAVVIFQPAEEGGAGGKAMCDDGLMERFGISEVYAIHNLPGLPVGEFAICEGPIMAATDEFNITLQGVGAHAAMPHQGRDSIVAGAQLVSALQTIASRDADPLKSIVVSVTQFHAGSAHNIIPRTAEINGTVRTLDGEMRVLGEKRLREICDGVASTYGIEITVDYRHGYPVTVNDSDATQKAIDVAKLVAGEARVHPAFTPMMGGEDFAYMLEERPGAYIFLGNGDSAKLHTPDYDFNDDAIPFGASYFAKLVETQLA